MPWPRLHLAYEILKQQPSSLDVYSKNFTDVGWEFFLGTLHHFNGNLDIVLMYWNVWHVPYFQILIEKCVTHPSSHCVSEPPTCRSWWHRTSWSSWWGSRYFDREGVLIYGSSREYSCIMVAYIGWGWILNHLYIFWEDECLLLLY